VTKPAVSIVMPTFNRRHLLPGSVASVRNQSFQDWELLIVDDHSTDDTKALVESWQTDDPRIHYLLNTRTKGPAGARNTGVDAARGEYLAFLDSDDEWLPHHLGRMTYFLNAYPDRIDMMTANAEKRLRSTGEVYAAAVQRNLDSGIAGRCEEAWVFDPHRIFDELFEHGILVTQTIVMRASRLNAVRFREELPPGPEDHFFQMELARDQVRCAYLNDVHVIYWAHGENLTVSGGIAHPRKIEQLYKTYQKQYALMLETFRLSQRQKRSLLDLMAREAFWQIGYNGHLQLGETAEARRWFLKAIRIRPWRFTYWKTLAGSYLRSSTSL